MDKLEARNVFADVAARDQYVSSLRPPDEDALAEMGIRLTTQRGSVVFSTLSASSSSSSSSASPPPQRTPSAAGAAGAQPDKATWPELKNTPAAEALAIIETHRPDVKAMLVPQVDNGDTSLRSCLCFICVFFDGSVIVIM